MLPVAISNAFKAMGEGGEDALSNLSRKKSSKKDALAASTARKADINKGPAVQTYPCNYYGTVNVSSAKGDDTLQEGELQPSALCVRWLYVRLTLPNPPPPLPMHMHTCTHKHPSTQTQNLAGQITCRPEVRFLTKPRLLCPTHSRRPHHQDGPKSYPQQHHHSCPAVLPL